ncbi:MAG: hypothetical protein ACR2MY_10075 [Candidatus Dormibacteria bacterium]
MLGGLAFSGCEYNDTTTGSNTYDISTEGEPTTGGTLLSASVGSGKGDGTSRSGQGGAAISENNGTASGSLIGLSTAGNVGSGYIAVAPQGSASGSSYGAGGNGASAPWAVTVSGPATSTSSNGVAVSAQGDATGAWAVSGTGNANSTSSRGFSASLTGCATGGATSVSGGALQTKC